jgi:hypothetical protein
LPASLPSAGQFGVQHEPIYIIEPIGQPHLPPQPSEWPASLPSAGQLGVQQPPP